MKGIVMNLLADMVEERLSLEDWNSILNESGFSGAYTAGGLYDDAELLTLVGIISRRSGKSADELVFAFGAFMFPAFARRYPELIDTGIGFLDFLETIDDVIHVEVRKLYPDAITPAFTCIRHAPDRLEMQYGSERKLCRLAEGLISGAAGHFQAIYELHHSPCLLDGADYCGLMVTSK